MKKNIILLLGLIFLFSCKKENVYVSDVSFYINDSVYCTQTGGALGYNAGYINNEFARVYYYLMEGSIINGQNVFISSKPYVQFGIYDATAGKQTFFDNAESIDILCCYYNNRRYDYASGYITLQKTGEINPAFETQNNVTLSGTFEATLVCEDNNRILPNDTIHITNGKFYFNKCNYFRFDSGTLQ